MGKHNFLTSFSIPANLGNKLSSLIIPTKSQVFVQKITKIFLVSKGGKDFYINAHELSKA